MTLTPILLPIACDASCTPSERVRQQRHHARRALRECAARCGAPLDGWEQNADGKPLPQAGWHWSISHKRTLAAAVIADHPVGIDVEHIEPRNESLWTEAASDAEWSLLGGRDWPRFFRIWTAKEAVLKAHGVGLARLDDCRIVQIPDTNRSVVAFQGQPFRVEHFHVGQHIAAVTCRSNPVHWLVWGDA